MLVCGNARAEIQAPTPGTWKHANLKSLEAFLKQEIFAGRYKPQEGLPFH